MCALCHVDADWLWMHMQSCCRCQGILGIHDTQQACGYQLFPYSKTNSCQAWQPGGIAVCHKWRQDNDNAAKLAGNYFDMHKIPITAFSRDPITAHLFSSMASMELILHCICLRKAVLEHPAPTVTDLMPLLDWRHCIFWPYPNVDRDTTLNGVWQASFV